MARDGNGNDVELCYTEMMRCLCFLRLWALGLGLALTTAVPAAQTRESTPEERYGPTFYGIRLPETGARLLLVIDTSKSMRRKDSARADGGRRWDTLLDEVRTMAEEMEKRIATRKVCFTVSLLYEGGEAPHPGSAIFDLAQKGATERLLAELSGKEFSSGGCFETTFGETLWPLVARHHITHVIYLGDNDIAQHADAVRDAVSAWYALPKAEPDARQRPLWHLKRAWWKPWERWRRPTQGVPTFRAQQAYPPPPRDVTFSTVAIGQTSPFLKALAELGQGTHAERVTKRPRRSKNRVDEAQGEAQGHERRQRIMPEA